MPHLERQEKPEEIEIDGKTAVRWTAYVAIILASIIAALMWGCPQYSVYTNRMGGQAEFERAEQNRKIKIEEARAALESAKFHADAEITRAKGTAEANRILAEQLGGPDNYLRWRTIQMLEETGKGAGRETVYIPTEAMMPITEANRKR